MKKLRKLKSIFLVTILLSFTYSCDDESSAPEMKPNIVQTAQATAALSSLVAALQKADDGTTNNLVATLSSDTKFTVFAPTNDAFTALFAQLDDYNSLADFVTVEQKNLLAKILTYHVVAGAAVKSTDLTNNQSIKTVQEENVTIRIADGSVFVQDATDVDAKVVVADVEASNGIVHVIDKVLIPQAVLDQLEAAAIAGRTLVDVVVNTDALSVLEAAVIKTDLVATLSSAGPFTVFAPTDDAFVALLNALGNDYNTLADFNTPAEIDLLRNILLYHVIPARVTAAELAVGSVATAFAGNSIDVIASGGTFVIGDASTTDATITGTDIFASNGVAHTINKVLLPQAAIDFVERITNKTLVDIVIATDPLSILEAAVIKTGLVDTLKGAGPFTVFAPTNDAFVALLNALGDDYTSLDDFNTTAEIDLLRNILLYHVIPSEVRAGQLAAGMVGTAFTGNSVEVIASGNTFVIGDASAINANITGTDILATNGVAHTIDKVLLPASAVEFAARAANGTLVDIVVATPSLSILEAAVIKTGLVATLNGAGPFTVFAPTDAAFVALLNLFGGDFPTLGLDAFNTTAEINALRDILLYHVVPGQVLASDLTAGSVATAFTGNSITVVASGNTFVIRDTTTNTTDAGITATNILATNGVAHVINQVLVPLSAFNILH
jgi:uncharacterized surface protein with fasciclin (FAS1) repeats